MALDPDFLLIVILYNIFLFISIYIILYIFFENPFNNFFITFLLLFFSELIFVGIVATIDPICLKKKLVDTSTTSTETFDNSLYSVYDAEDTAANTIIENAPEPVTSDKSFVFLSSDEEIQAQAEKNIQKQIDLQPNILDTSLFHEQAETDLIDNFLANKYPLTATETQNKSQQQIKDIRRQKAETDKIDIYSEIINSSPEFQEEIKINGQANYEKYLNDNIYLSPDEQQKTDENGDLVDLTYEELIEKRKQKVLDKSEEEKAKKNNNLQGKINETNAFLKKRAMEQAKQEKIEDLKNQQLEKIQEEEKQKLLEKEIQYLTDQRYVQGNIYKSESLLEHEYKNPYNILPLDLWFRPEAGAKDLIGGKSCDCPVELRLDSLNYSKYEPDTLP